MFAVALKFTSKLQSSIAPHCRRHTISTHYVLVKPIPHTPACEGYQKPQFNPLAKGTYCDYDIPCPTGACRAYPNYIFKGLYVKRLFTFFAR